ncbi:calcium/sodium antiporter [Tranquillimonas alkanivorans]|uniref:Cation:H+ antiporter n=1 Tax=Tranquillimonas alkanivorans TaxID=441119 RepID=A0A1I5ML52_9RHOB|nr:calcium/sodium antiporter [Tranquillimonas alkanivorans]SFP09661.1 cation:H+ antiporter [Tranquillimonas alkanivorans]
MTILFLVLGFAGLFFGGDWLVRGAAGIAGRVGISPLVIGLTVVGFGTSTPELLVSVQAALEGLSGVAIGNVVGSNLANILLILGLSAVVAPLTPDHGELRRDLIVMTLAALALPLIFLSGSVGLIEGLVLVGALAVYLWLCLRAPGPVAAETELPHAPVWKSVGFALLGLVAVLVGARLLVDAAVEIARGLGVSEALIGLTIVAVGTSLPELATSLMAAIRGQRDIAIGNVVGSNIFNILGILGVTAIIAPIPVDARFLSVDAPVLIAITLALVALVVFAGRIGRLSGIAMLAIYAIYIFATRTL